MPDTKVLSSNGEVSNSIENGETQRSKLSMAVEFEYIVK